MKRLLTIILVLIMLCGCANQQEDNNTAKGNDLVLSADKIQEIMSEGEYIIVDVRTEEEYNQSHIKEAINIPYDEIDENVELDKEKNIFVYCYSGGRSAIARKTLENLGYQVYDLGAFESIDLPKE